MKYVSKRPPRAKQAEALAKCDDQKVFALLMAMRTGKTKVVLDDFGRLYTSGKADDLCIIAPAGSYLGWPKDAKEEWPDVFYKSAQIAVWESGAGKGKMKALAHFMKQRKGPRMLVMNIEALSTVKQARAMVLEFIQQRRCYCAVDESTTIKNIDSTRTSFVVEQLGPLATYKRILSGLPTPRSPLDLFTQFQFLDASILRQRNYAAFKARYAIEDRICLWPQKKLIGYAVKRLGKKFYMEGVGTVEPGDLLRQDLLRLMAEKNIYVPTVPKIKGYRNEEELRDLIAPYSFRCRLQDCYDLPEKMYSVRYVEPTPEQRRIYNELRNYNSAMLESGDYVSATQVIACMLRMHQVLLGHVVDEQGGEHTIASNRDRELVKLLNEYEGKAIIWCSYDYNVQAITNALRKEFGEESVVRFWGGNRKTREEEQERFRTDPAVRFIVATPSAGGRGKEWSAANLVIYYSNTDNLEHRDQSEERAQAVGKKDQVMYVDLCVKGTVEGKIINSLRKKLDMATVINGDNYRDWLI